LKKVEKYASEKLFWEINEITNSERLKELPKLNVYEKAIVFKYSNDGFEDLNESLRINKGKNLTEFGKLLDTVLLKLSDFEGLVFRKVFLSKSELEKYIAAYKEKKIITEQTFISTSKSRLIAMEFKGNTFFRIYSKTGKEIEKIAKFGIHSPPNEKEVLFAPNKQFQVLEVNELESYTLVTMEEI